MRKSYKTKGKVPYITQMQQTECGVCCAAMMLRYYRSNETMTELREYLEVGRDGLSMDQLRNLMIHKGFDAKVYKAKPKGLTQITLPAILFWNNSHYVILEKIGRHKMVLVDPAFGRKKVTYEEFMAGYSGYVLTAVPTERFEPLTKKQPNVWIPYLKKVKAFKMQFTSILLLSLVSYMMTLSLPMLVQYLIDHIAMEGRWDLLDDFSGVICGYVILYGCLMYIRGKRLISLNVFLGKSLLGDIFHHIMKLPYKFFETRKTGDLLFRLNSLHAVRDLLSRELIKGIIDLGAIGFIVVYMMMKSYLLAGVAIALFLLNGIITITIRPKILEANQKEIVENGEVQSMQVEALVAMFGIKISGIEDKIYNNWNEQFGKFLVKYKFREKVQNLYGALSSIVQIMSPLIILVLGVIQYFNGVLSLGEVIAFHTLSGTFFGLGAAVFGTYNAYIVTSSYLERVQDISQAEIEKNPKEPIEHELTGNIELRNVSFAYTKHANEVIKDVSLTIEKGKKIAIVGASGSGKTTLSKLLMGLYEPVEGQIYYDGIESNRLKKQDLRSQIGVVPQDITLFNRTIYDNITMNNEVEIEEVKEAAAISQISHEIESMPMGYHTTISEMGLNLSGGQRQRIALARALVHQPKILILDEATSSLDLINERRVSSYLSKMGCTRIVIAHRLSTIIDADMIYVMDEGKIVEKGTHAKLMQGKGKYYGLYNTYIKDMYISEEEVN